MKVSKLVAAAVSVVLGTAIGMGSAGAECKSVNGNISSRVVTQFSNGEPCLSPVGICTEGRFIGGLKGDFTFTANTLVPTPEPSVAFTTGDINLLTDCGTLVLRDASAFSLEADGQYAGLDTVDQTASTGGCAGASGRIRAFGIFIGGCVACDYRGEICFP